MARMRLVQGRRSPCLWLLIARITTAAVVYDACEGDESADHLRLSRLRLSPDPVMPSEQLCVHFDAAPDVPLGRGSRVRLEIDEAGILGELGGADYDLCNSARISCPGNEFASKNMSGVICDDIPLAAMILGAHRVHFTLKVSDESGAPVGCVSGSAPIADAISIDADVEAFADAAAHQPLRRALMSTEDARSGAAAEPEHARAAAVRRKLQEAYDASPEWADAFARWRAAHGRRYLQGEGPEQEAQAVLAEAHAFAQFRENVLALHRAGRSLSVDSRSDKTPDARRTLSHFG